MHHITSGFKSIFTQTSWNMCKKLRLACGGAGYSVFAGIEPILSDMAPSTTYECDNSVMAIQSSRFLYKTLKSIEKGIKATDYLSYLNNID